MLPPLRFLLKNRFESLDFALQRLDFVRQEIGMNSGGQPQQEVDSEVSWNFHDCISKVMAADIFTKQFADKDEWEHVCALIGVISQNHIMSLQRQNKFACPAVFAQRDMSAPRPPPRPSQLSAVAVPSRACRLSPTSADHTPTR